MRILKKYYPQYRYILAFFIYFLLAIYGCRDRNAELTKQGNELVAKVEAYKKRTDSLPSSLKALGINETEEGPLYYQRKDSINFIIWFGTSLGKSKIYYSNSKKWEDK